MVRDSKITRKRPRFEHYRRVLRVSTVRLSRTWCPTYMKLKKEEIGKTDREREENATRDPRSDIGLTVTP